MFERLSFCFFFLEVLGKMAETSTVRLVRCPKCENLLPELPEFSVYQCGGCGAVLRGTGKVMMPTSDGLLEKSHDESGLGSSEKEGASLESGSGSIIERETSEDCDLHRTKERVIHGKATNLNSSSSSRTENSEVLVDSDRSMRGRSDHNKIGVDYNAYLRKTRLSNTNGSDIGSMGISNEPSETRRPFGSLRSRPVMDQWSLGRKGSGPFLGKNRGVLEEGRFGALSNLDEGPSNYRAGPFNRYDEQIRNRDGLDGLARVKDLENDRAELLRKLDELKDQLTRTCDIAEKPKERLDPHGGHNDFKPEGSTSSYNVTIPPEPPYFDHYHGAVPYAKNHLLEMQDFYPPLQDVPNEYLGYGGTYHPQVVRRPSHQPPHQYLPPSYNGHFREPRMDYYTNPFVSHPHETYFHQPSCSCLRCYSTNRQRQIPPKVPSPFFKSQDPTYPTFDSHRNPVTFGTPGYSYRISQDRSHMRSSSDLPADNVGDFGHRHPRKVIVARASGRVCHPIAGGAPLVSCCNCFELLKIPSKLIMMGKNQRKMKCGACSAVILFELENKNLVVSVPAPTKQVRSKGGGGSGGTSNKSLLSSVDYENSGYQFHLTDCEPNQSLNDQRSSEAEKRQELSFSSSSVSDNEESPDTVIIRREDSEFCELPPKNNGSLPHPDSPLGETLDSRYAKVNRSKRNDQEKGIINLSVTRQNSVQDASVATEMDVPMNEYLNSGVDSVDMSKEEDRVRNKGSESFFAGFIKKSFRDFSRSSRSAENGRSNVFVNGQPIPDRVVKKAEKLAGPIQPGEYWYDFQAGFWGVMKQPCLGVIPPFIEEFNYPMPENCAAGNTGVFVNGRELHRRDLDLLAGRGLPTMSDKSYIIEISGRVLDEDTGEELDGLGKLAPTVERLKRGFGMKVPRAISA